MMPPAPRAAPPALRHYARAAPAASRFLRRHAFKQRRNARTRYMLNAVDDDAVLPRRRRRRRRR